MSQRVQFPPFRIHRRLSLLHSIWDIYHFSRPRKCDLVLYKCTRPRDSGSVGVLFSTFVMVEHRSPVREIKLGHS